MSSDFIPITRLSDEIKKTTGQPGPGYRRLQILAWDAKIPAEQRGRIWGVCRKDFPELLVALGLADQVAA